MERSAAAIESSPEPAPAKKRGRPPGSKNKPKEAAAPESAPATDAPAAPTTTAVDNGGDPEDSAKERGAYYRRRPQQSRIIRCIDRRPISRCSHEHRTLYGHATRRAPHARREIRLLLILSCDFFSRQRTRNRNLVA